MKKKIVSLIVVGLFLATQVFAVGFQQLDHSVKSTTQAIAFGQDLGFGNGDTINSIKLYLEPFDLPESNSFKVQLWSDTTVDIWSDSIPIGEVGVKELYTFTFPSSVELLVGEEFGFAVDSTGSKAFHIYGSDNPASWPGGVAWNGGLGSVVDLYFNINFEAEAPGYSRNPSGYTISNPVGFDISFASYDDLKAICETEDEFIYWGLYFQHSTGEIWDSEMIPVADLDYIFSKTLPIETYYEVKVGCFVDIEDLVGEGYLEEIGEGVSPIFEVVAGPPGYNYLDLDPNLPVDMLAMAGTLFTDLGSLITMAVGVPMGFVVIKKIISLIAK